MCKFIQGALCASATWVMLTGCGGETVHGTQGEAVPEAVSVDSSLGFAMQPERRALLDCVETEWRSLVAKLYPSITPRKLGPSGCLHAMRLLGTDLRAESSKEGDAPRLLAVFTNAEQARAGFGSPLILESRHGVRYRRAISLYPPPGRMHESHQGQVFASLAEMNVPLSTPVHVQGADRTVQDVLTDAIASFDFRGEVEWKCIAAIYYMTGLKSWTNRYGEVFTFDDIARELAGSDVRASSCGGTHVFHTLNLLVRVDEARSLLGEDARAAAVQKLAAWTQLALDSQRADGSWLHTWWLADADAAENQPGSLLVTGHIAESFLYLPRDLSVEDDVLRRAGLWLLEQLRDASVADCKLQLCPYTHAACVVRQLR